jgi:CheY-like chemotaxis protein
MNNLPILIVDDDLVDRLSLERWCKKNLVEYQIANNGLEALNLTKKNNYSLILSDIDMPIMNGISLIEEIRKSELITKKHLPVIAISANIHMELESQFKKFGFDYFLTKPAPQAELNKIFQMFLFQ